MKVIMTRHGLTAGNAAKQYVGGGTDIPLSKDGRAELEKLPRYNGVTKVYASSMKRTRQTAAILYPDAECIAVPGFREMHFGEFEGKDWQELSGNNAYIDWIADRCESKCPGGESRGEFVDRVAAAFEKILAHEDGSELHLVIHGGTIMALLSRYAGRDYFSSNAKPGQHWVCELDKSDGITMAVAEAPEGITI